MTEQLIVRFVLLVGTMNDVADTRRFNGQNKKLTTEAPALYPEKEEISRQMKRDERQTIIAIQKRSFQVATALDGGVPNIGLGQLFNHRRLGIEDDLLCYV